MFIFAEQPQTISNLIKDIFKFYKITVGKVFFLVLSMAVLSNALSPHLFGLNIHQQQHLYMLLSVLSTLVAIYFLCAIYKKMYLLGIKQQEKLANILRSVVPDFLIVIISKLAFIILLAILIILIFLVCAIFVAIPMLPITWIFSISHEVMLHIGIIITGIIGGILFLICAVFLHVAFLFYIPLILFDRAGPLDVIGKSISFVWGHWWRTFAVALATFLLAAIIFAPFYILLLHHFMPYFHDPNFTAPYMFNIWWAVLNIVVSLLLVPWLSSVVLVLYNDLKLRKLKMHT